jgi:hypothetical protein
MRSIAFITRLTFNQGTKILPPFLVEVIPISHPTFLEPGDERLLELVSKKSFCVLGIIYQK